MVSNFFLAFCFIVPMFLIKHAYALDDCEEHEEFSHEEASGEEAYPVGAIETVIFGPPALPNKRVIRLEYGEKPKCARRLDYGGPPITHEEVKAGLHKLLPNQ